MFFEKHDYIEFILEQFNEKVIELEHKPVIVGELAMEYYGLKDGKTSIDLIVHLIDWLSLLEHCNITTNESIIFSVKMIDHVGKYKTAYIRISCKIKHLEYNYYFFKSESVNMSNYNIVNIYKLLVSQTNSENIGKLLKAIIEIPVNTYYCL